MEREPKRRHPLSRIGLSLLLLAGIGMPKSHKTAPSPIAEKPSHSLSAVDKPLTSAVIITPSPFPEPPAVTPTVEATPMRKTNRLLVFGDSISQISLDANPTELAENGGSLVNLGFDGITTEGYLEKIPDILKKYPDKDVVIQLGANDAEQNVPVDQFEANLENIVRLSQKAGCRVTIATIPRPNPDLGMYKSGQNPYNVDPYNQAIEKIKKKLGLMSGVDLVPELREGNFHDYVHPNSPTAKRIVDLYKKLLEKLKSQKP